MSPSSAKRHRKRQNAAAARAAQLEAARQAKRRQTLIRSGILGVFVLAVAVVLALVAGGGDDKKEVTAGKDATTTSSAEASSTTTPETTATTAAGAAAGEITCNDTEPPAKGNGKTYDKAPDMTIDPAKNYTATMDTSCGKMVIELDAKNAPVGVNNFVFLARENFYDGLTFHRVIKDFVIQGGDPKGDGTGGPGYDVPAEPPKDRFKIGDLAAAKAANDPPGTMGSQFFVITGSRGAALPNEYARFGTVTDGVKVAQKIESFGQPDESPSRTLYIFDVAITES
ncbi:MAG: peptidylprolyl isomerase [Actinomycetota bacterium]|nr:peptidylprolyl isomerase [Actinomycetota bacterium]